MDMPDMAREFTANGPKLGVPRNKGLNGYDWKEVSDRSCHPGGGPEITQQHFAEEQDINTIMRRFGVTGQMPFGNQAGAFYGDFTEIQSYEDAERLIERTKEQFMSLPAEVRLKFGNSPARLLEFARSASYEEFLEATNPPPVNQPNPAGEATPPPTPPVA